MSTVLKQGPRPYSRDFQPMPAEVPALELVPKEPAKQGFVARLPPVTEADHIAVGIAVNADKATPEWRAASDHFALEQQNNRTGAGRG